MKPPMVPPISFIFKKAQVEMNADQNCKSEVMDNSLTVVPVAPGWLPYFHYISVTMKSISKPHHIIRLSVH